MIRRRLTSVVVALTGVAGLAACTDDKGPARTPGLAGRGTVMTTAKPVRQDLSNKVSVGGKVVINPVYGLVAPVDGEVRYLDVRQPGKTPTKETRVATVWAGGKANHVAVPAGSAFAGRLVDDRSTVPAGTPIVSAHYAGYGIVAEIDGGQVYQIAGAVGSVQAQITNGPGPFACATLGTIAALPAGTVPPEPDPVVDPGPGATGAGGTPGAGPAGSGPGPGTAVGPGGNDAGGNDSGGTASGGQPVQKSDPTGLRLVCTPPAGVKMINGAAATLEVVTQRATNVLALPVEAVAGGQGRGKVDIVGPDGQRQTRDVELGLTDGRMIEIRSGLTGDETIAVPGPNLPQPPDKDGPGWPPRIVGG